MTDEPHALAALTDEGLQALLKRAIRVTLIVGALAALVLWKASGWRDAAMLATGAAISAASIHEWRRRTLSCCFHQFDTFKNRDANGYSR